jgi:DNA-binding GntR family transcriptional regulator
MPEDVRTLSTVSRPETLTAAVARHVRAAIMHGEFLPGQALPEFPLSEQLGVSRGTFREAIRLLADEGLVEVFPHRGAFVTQLTASKAREIYTLRAELESYAVQLAVSQLAYTAADWSELEATVSTLSMGPVGGVFEIAAIDMRFHELLSRRCGHELLLDTLASLRLQMLRFIVYTKLVDSDLEPEAVTHRRLLESVRRGNAAVARRAVHTHITEAGQQLLRKVQVMEKENDSWPGN